MLGRRPYILSEWVHHINHECDNVICNHSKHHAAILLWGQFFTSRPQLPPSLDISLTGIAGQYWDGITSRDHIVVVHRRRKIRREWSVPLFTPAKRVNSAGGKLPSSLGRYTRQEDLDFDTESLDQDSDAPEFLEWEEQPIASRAPSPLVFSGGNDPHKEPEHVNLQYCDDVGARRGQDILTIEFEGDLTDGQKSAAALCSICNNAIVTSGLRCTECRRNGFDICKHCFEAGGWCNNSNHKLGEGCYRHTQLLPGHRFNPPEMEEVLSVWSLDNGGRSLFEHQKILKSHYFDSLPIIHPSSYTIAWYLPEDQILFFQSKAESSTLFSPKITPHKSRFYGFGLTMMREKRTDLGLQLSP